MPTPEELGASAPRSPFTDHLGIEFVEGSGERVVATLDAGERHHRPFGPVHGGVYASLVETVASVGAYLRVAEAGGTVVGVHNSTHFLRPHWTGRLRAVGVPVAAGDDQQVWEVAITREEDGKDVARGQVRLQNLPAGADQPR